MENKNAPAGAQSVMDIGILAPAEIEFYKNPQGFLAMKKGEEDFKRVRLSRILPFAQPMVRELGVYKDQIPGEKEAEG